MNPKALLFVLPLTACVNLHARSQQQLAYDHQRACTDAAFAYESGYNAGIQRTQLDTSWVDYTCTVSYRARTRDQYMAGYNNGMANAPIVIQGTVHHTGSVGVGYSGESCRFASDCGEGRSCRADASGQSVCMGGGYAGDACWFSSDCVSDSCDISSKTCR